MSDEDINKREPCVFLDFAEQQGGFEKPPSGLGQEKCPKCGEETANGFGLMGGGYGSYVFCLGDHCGWFYKEQSKDGAE